MLRQHEVSSAQTRPVGCSARRLAYVESRYGATRSVDVPDRRMFSSALC
jgi:hypothetical protein